MKYGSFASLFWSRVRNDATECGALRLFSAPLARRRFAWGCAPPLHNISGAARIENDTITFVGYYETPRVGIAIADTALSSFPVGDTLAGNQIAGGYYGISNSYRYGQHIIENTVSVTPPTLDTAVGINLFQCPFTRVSCNDITGGGTGDTNSLGIVYNAPDTGSQMLYNTLSVLGTGFIANNTTKVRLINNAFENSMIGINVNGSHATIGNQGGIDDTTYDNVWEGPFFNSMILTSNGAEDITTDIFYVRSDSITDPNTGLTAIFDPVGIENKGITGAFPVEVQVVTSAKQYLPNFLTTGICSPPSNIQLRMPYFGNNSTSPVQDTVTPQSPQLSYKLIPNLYRDNFTAYITLGTDEQGQVQIYNVDGILMGKYTIGPGKNELNLSNAGLVAGVYLYKVFVNGQIKTNDKLVVVH